jgi:hypothetical protein
MMRTRPPTGEQCASTSRRCTGRFASAGAHLDERAGVEEVDRARGWAQAEGSYWSCGSG